jgi:hypothetical protein
LKSSYNDKQPNVNVIQLTKFDEIKDGRNQKKYDSVGNGKLFYNIGKKQIIGHVIEFVFLFNDKGSIP